MSGSPSPNRGAMIVLAYLWVLAFVPLMLEKDDAEVQWHAKNGIVLMAAELVGLLAFVIFMSLASIATLGFGCVLGLFGVFLWVAILALHLVAIVKGLGGNRLVVPGVSVYAERF